MRTAHLAKPLGGALLLGALALLAARCFSPVLPDCSYRCGAGDGTAACPEEYECREDRYCHLKGSTAACPYTMDLQMPAPAQDLRPSDGGDGGGADGGGDL